MSCYVDGVQPVINKGFCMAVAHVHLQVGVLSAEVANVDSGGGGDGGCLIF